MDRKVEYVDLNGLQFFADELRRYLNQNILNVPILTELKVRIENLEDRDFYKIIESYDKLPNPGSNSIIYLVPNRGDGSLLEYIWTKNGYEQLGSFSPELRLDEYLKSEDAENKYLKISDSPFEKGEAEHSAVLKGGGNKATNDSEFAVGQFNKSESDTRFSIGIGTSDTKRKNAVEAKQNGDVYIIGIGGFTGENRDSSQSVQEVINELVDIINQITEEVK